MKAFLAFLKTNWIIGSMGAVAFAAIFATVWGMLAIPAHYTAEDNAFTAQQTAIAQQSSAVAAGLPAVPAITTDGIKGGAPVNPEASVVAAYKTGLLQPPTPARVGTMADVELANMSFSYLFNGNKWESVTETLIVHNTVGYPLKSLVVPLLSGAYNGFNGKGAGYNIGSSYGFLNITPGTATTPPTMTVPITIPVDNAWHQFDVVYQVPINFGKTQVWTMPAYSFQGLLVLLGTGEAWGTIDSTDLFPAPALDADMGTGWRTWATAGDTSQNNDAPVKAGTMLTWVVGPSAEYPKSAYLTPPGNPLGPAASPACQSAIAADPTGPDPAACK